MGRMDGMSRLYITCVMLDVPRGGTTGKLLVTLEAVEVFGISRNPWTAGQRSGPHLLSISHHSPGLQCISRILQASLTDLRLTAPCL